MRIWKQKASDRTKILYYDLSESGGSTWWQQSEAEQWGTWCGRKAVAMNSGDTGLTWMELSFLSQLDMATSVWEPINVDLIRDVLCPLIPPDPGQILSLFSLKGSRWYILSAMKDIIKLIDTCKKKYSPLCRPICIFLWIHSELLSMHWFLNCIYWVATMCHRLNYVWGNALCLISESLQSIMRNLDIKWEINYNLKLNYNHSN